MNKKDKDIKKKIEEFNFLTVEQKIDRVNRVRNGFVGDNGIWVTGYPAGKLRDKLDVYIQELERKVK